MFRVRPYVVARRDHRGAVAELRIEFAGERIDVTERLSFGRSAQLSVDENRHLHRQVGEVFADRGLWWLRNLGSRIHLTVHGSDGGRVELPPGAVAALTAPLGRISFSAGPTRYELEYQLSDQLAPGGAAALVVGESTTQLGLVLTPREVDFLVAFARPLLLGLEAPSPTYAEVAAVWGVAPKTLDNTVQAIKRKVRDAGLGRDLPLDAIVRALVRQGLVTVDDLQWSNIGVGPPRSAVSGPRFTR